MDDLNDWRGLLAPVARGEPTEVLQTPIRPSDTGAAPFLGVMESGRTYWVKTLENPQGPQILVNERVVSALGSLIGAPVRPAAILEIPPDLAGWKYGELLRLRPGLAHGSLHLEPADVADELLHTRQDDNATRQPAISALWDWCLGEDEQWLYATADQYSMWSFDHGLWIGGGFDWDVGTLRAVVDKPWGWEHTGQGMSAEAFHSVADRLEKVRPSDILVAVASVPPAWGMPDEPLEALAWMLWRRRERVAERLRVAAART